jgi:hypothetical protein
MASKTFPVAPFLKWSRMHSPILIYGERAADFGRLLCFRNEEEGKYEGEYVDAALIELTGRQLDIPLMLRPLTTTAVIIAAPPSWTLNDVKAGLAHVNVGMLVLDAGKALITKHPDPNAIGGTVISYSDGPPKVLLQKDPFDGRGTSKRKGTRR